MSFSSDSLPIDSTQINYQEQMDLLDFVNIDEKVFSLQEIE
jgi:hypothetical protein